MYQTRYWKELIRLKTHIYYLELYLQETKTLDTGMRIILAVTSSTSICGWAIWNKYSFIWGVVIAISQLLNVVKAFLPYEKRLTALSGLLHELDELFLTAEMKWYDVAEGRLSEEEIHRLHMQIKQARAKRIRKYVGSSPLREKRKHTRNAERMAETYFSTFYKEEEGNGKTG